MYLFENGKFHKLAATLAIICALAACRTSAQSYIARGRKALDNGKYAEAEIDFTKATQMKAGLPDGWYGLGQAQFRQKKPANAYPNLRRARDLAPAREDIAAAFGDVCIALYLSDPMNAEQLYRQAQSVYFELLKRNPKSWDGMRLKGLVAMLDRHYPDAIAAFRLADAIKPRQSEVTQPLMEALIENGQGAEAEKTGREFLAHDQHAAAVYDTLYRWYTLNHDAAAAEKLLIQKVEANPRVENYRLQLAGYYASTKKTAEMTATLEKLVSDSHDFPEGYLSAANFLAVAGLYDDALNYLERGAKGAGNKTKYILRKAELLAQSGKPDQAMSVLNGLLKTDPSNIDARSLRVGIEVESNNADAVRSAMQEIPDLLKSRPNDATLHYYLGRAQVARGDTEAALAQFEEAIRDNPTMVQARVLAANISMQRGDYDRAGQYSDDIVNLTRGNPAARLLRATALTGGGKFDEARHEIDALEHEYPNALEPKLQDAALRLAQKKYGEAEALYRDLHAANPRDMRPLEGLVETFAAQNRYDAAIDLLKQEKSKSPSPVLDSLIADVALRGNKFDLAVQQYGQIAAANPSSPFAHLRLGDAYMRKGDLPKAVDEFQKAKLLAPQDALANAMLALALHNAGRGEEAVKAYRDTLSLESGNPLVSNNLAYLMAENGGNLDEALKLAQAAARAEPKNEAIADTLGWIYLKKKLPDSAIQVLSNATRNAPLPIYRYHLAMAFYEKGDKEAAKRQCQAALASKPAQSDEKKIRELLAKVG